MSENSCVEPSVADSESLVTTSPSRFNHYSQNNKNKNNLFSIYHWNCFSVLNKIESIKMFLNEFKPDILSLNEIKLNDQEANYYLRFKGYSTYFNCRKKGAGGVALLVRNETDHHKISEFDYLNLEIETVNVRIGSSNVLIASYYNPPDKILQELLFLEIEKKTQKLYYMRRSQRKK